MQELTQFTPLLAIALITISIVAFMRRQSYKRYMQEKQDRIDKAWGEYNKSKK